MGDEPDAMMIFLALKVASSFLVSRLNTLTFWPSINLAWPFINTTPLVLNAMKQAVERTSKLKTKVILHSDQGSQYASYEYKVFSDKNNIIPSMSRRGNCYDNAVAESFFKTLKKELVRKHIFLTREIAKSKIFEYMEMFYNAKRRHSYLGYISPNEFEKRYNNSVK